MKHIGNEIDTILFKRQLKKKDFANSIGMSDVNLSKVLKKASLDAALLEKIAQALNIPASYFFENTISSAIEKNKILEKTLVRAGKSQAIEAVENIGRQMVADDNARPSTTDRSITGEERLWTMIESQQRMLESQQRTIEEFTKKGAAEAAPAAARKVARG